MSKKNIPRERLEECSPPLPPESPETHAEEGVAALNGKGSRVQDKAGSSGPAKPLPQKRAAAKQRLAAPAAKSAKKSASKKRKRSRKKKKGHSFALQLFLTGLETGSLLAAGVAVLMVLLGYGGQYLTGTSFFYNLLPFALALIVLILTGAVFLHTWRRLRAKLAVWHPLLAPLLAVILAAGTGILLQGQYFTRPLAQFRLLVGGTAEMRALTLRHQIFAAYRRLDADDMAKMLVRAQIYAPDIAEAARIFDIDADILNGLAAAESSFYPRTSADGGQGLFQITSIPTQAQEQALAHLDSDTADMAIHRHNTFAAAATLRYYLKQMNGNMVLALLAYNIGPANGGLRHIMERYSATDFITIQPYLQEKPRNYPVRVLSFALAFRVNRVEQRLLPYEDGLNAIRVQHIGIPGL